MDEAEINACCMTGVKFSEVLRYSAFIHTYVRNLEAIKLILRERIAADTAWLSLSMIILYDYRTIFQGGIV